MNKRESRAYILAYARNAGLSLQSVEAWKYVLHKKTKAGKVVYNIYWNKKNRLFTVGTAMNHPSKGKTQLWRKGIPVSEVIKLIDNPRQHTGRGYYKK